MFEEFNPSTSTTSGGNERTVFPPLITALDTYLDSDSNEKLHDILTEVKTEKPKKKTKKKKSPKKNNKPKPPDKLPESFNEVTSPKKGKVRLLPSQDFEEMDERIRNDFSESAPNSVKYPSSPPHSVPGGPRSITTPRTAPRGGRFYKQIDQPSIGSQTLSIEVRFQYISSGTKLIFSPVNTEPSPSWSIEPTEYEF